MSEKATCELCGNAMPEGEEMFKYHGLSGPCPSPPLPRPVPLIWVVLDENGLPIHCTSHELACHEHVNDAINEYRIDEAKKWTVRRAILAPNAALNGAAQAASE